MTIIKPSTAFKQSADWVSAEVRAYMTDQVSTHVDTVQDVRDNDLERTRFLWVRETGAPYRLDLSSGEPDDGSTVIHDNVGRRYVRMPVDSAITPELEELRDEAVDAADAATNDADRARDEADRAQSASDSAFVNADVYPDTAAGLAATSEGEQFQVAEEFEIVRYRHDAGPEATEIARYPASAGVVQRRTEDLDHVIHVRVVGDAVAQTLTETDDGTVYDDYLSGRRYRHSATGVIAETEGRQYSLDDIAGIAHVVVLGNAVLAVYPINGTPIGPASTPTTSESATEAGEPQYYSSSTHRDDIVYDMMRSFWVTPPVLDVNGNRYATGITRRIMPGHPGTVAIAQALQGTTIMTKVVIGPDVQPGILVDEHNAPAILFDPRPDAPWPFVVFQSPHNTGFPRMWRSRDVDATHLDAPVELTAVNGVTYNQCYRRSDNPAIVFNWIRGITGGPWHLMRWDNNVGTGQPDAVKTVFVPTIPDYFVPVPMDDGVFIFWSPHPSSTSGRTIRVMFLTWAGELLSWPGGTQIEDDIWTMPVPVDPQNHEYIVFNPGSGKHVRMTGVKQVAPLIFQLAVLTGDDVNMANSRVHLVTADFSEENDPAFSSVDVCDGGIRTGGASHYLAGADIIGEDKIIVTRWSAPGNADQTVLSIFDCSTGLPVETVIETYNYKVFRPMVAEKQSWNGSKIVREIGDWATLITGFHPETDDGTPEGNPVTALINNFKDFNTDMRIIQLGDYQ